MMDEPIYGGLIDKYYVLNFIIIVFLVVGSVYGLGKLFSCPYVEDVSSCFPYNLPNWVKLISIPVLIISMAVLLTIIKYIKSGRVDPE